MAALAFFLPSSAPQAATACTVDYSIPTRVRTNGIYKGEVKTSAAGALVSWRWAGKAAWNRADLGRTGAQRTFVVRFNSGTVPGSYAMVVKVTSVLCTSSKPFLVTVQ